MTFVLEFVDRRKRRARIRVGAFVEEFSVYGGFATYAYEKVWQCELEALFGRKKKVALPVAGAPSAISRAWIFYRIGDQAKIQDRLFVRAFDPRRSRVPARETVTEEGQQISEWSVDISAIEAFLRKPPNQPSQSNAGNRPSSGDSPAFTSRSVFAPRG